MGKIGAVIKAVKLVKDPAVAAARAIGHNVIDPAVKFGERTLSFTEAVAIRLGGGDVGVIGDSGREVTHLAAEIEMAVKKQSDNPYDIVHHPPAKPDATEAVPGRHSKDGHFQQGPKEGGKWLPGHTFYQVRAWVNMGGFAGMINSCPKEKYERFGLAGPSESSKCFAEGLDFFNPLSDASDVIGLAMDAYECVAGWWSSDD